MTRKRIIVATRPSKLAYTQTLQIVKKLKTSFSDLQFDIRKISTLGDRVKNRSLTEFGGTGVFVKEIEQTLIDEEVDIAIHSVKDMPSKLPDNLVLASFPKREDVRDILLSNKIDTNLAE